MNNKSYKKIVLILSISLQACASTAKEIYSCPEQISANTTIQSVPEQWSVDADGSKSHYLVGLTFSDGHPSDEFFLRPSETIENSNSELESGVPVYDLSNLEADHAWLVCMYGNTPVTLVKKLKQPYSTCTVSNNTDSSDIKTTCEK